MSFENKARIKVLYLFSDLRKCGPTNQFMNIVKHIDRSRFSPIVVTLSPEAQESEFGAVEKLVDRIFSLSSSRIGSVIKAKNFLENLIMKESVDIAHTSGFRSEIIAATHLKRIPKVITLRNYRYDETKDRFGRIIGRQLASFYYRRIKTSESIVACSSTIADAVRPHGIEAITIRNGVDVDEFTPVSLSEKRRIRRKLGIPEDEFMLVFTGRITALKDVPTLIRGFKKSKIHDRSVLLVLGDGEDMNRSILEADNDERIRFLGFKRNVKEYLQVSDLYVSASLSEGMPNSVLEALACGVPLYLSNIDQHKEVIEMDREVGFLFTKGSAESFAEVLDRIGNQDFEMMSRHARSLAEKEFSAREMSLRYQRTYEKLLEKSPR